MSVTPHDEHQEELPAALADLEPTARPDEPAAVPDEAIWPGLATPPHNPFRARIAEQLFRQAVKKLPVQVVMAGGERLGAGGPDDPVMRIVRPDAFFNRLGVDAKVGFGEAYMTGDWTSTRLAEVMTPFAARMSTLVPPLFQRLRGVVDARQPKTESGSIENAKTNIHRHYDLSNEMFGLFLDETMTYSSGLFDGVGGHGLTDLTAAQHRKIDSVLDYAGVVAGTHLLEIGTGWGTLAIQAAQRGARVTTLTISAEQKELAERRIAEAGMSDRVQVLLRDYREAQGQYDAIVSVEMIEAVGHDYWSVFFGALDRLLKPGGRIGLQAIVMPHDRMLATRNSYTWIHKYVFPGGLLPSITSIEQNLASHTSLRVVGRRDFGYDYARTLRLWRERFLAHWGEVAALGFDSTFRRMWEFYLAYCEAGFRSGYIGVSQLALAR